MTALLLTALTCLHAAAEELLPLSGRFNTIYLASDDLKEIAENGSAGILMRNVKFSKNYMEMEMTYYIRDTMTKATLLKYNIYLGLTYWFSSRIYYYHGGKHESASNPEAKQKTRFSNQLGRGFHSTRPRKHGKCQPHTLTAEKLDLLYKKILFSTFLGKGYKDMDPKDSVIGEWIVNNPTYHFSNIRSYMYQDGYKISVIISYWFRITYVSNTTMLFLLQYTHEQRRVIRVTVALSKGTNLTEDMREEYINLTKMQKIPIENIKNIYVTDTCPKWEPLT